MPEGEILFEKRRHKRVSKKLKVQYRLLDDTEEEALMIQKKKKTAESADISISGIQLICDERLENDSVIRIDIEIENKHPLSTFAEVRWVKKDETAEKFRVGLEFLVIKEDHIRIIQSLM